jgi:hypothetical protein
VTAGYSFWDHIYPLFLSRDITRHDMRELVRRGLATTRGNYRALLKLFNMANNIPLGHHPGIKINRRSSAYDAMIPRIYKIGPYFKGLADKPPLFKGGHESHRDSGLACAACLSSYDESFHR